MIKEAIILAGGLGTRLRDTISGPKCMAPVAGQPFLFHVINYLRSQGIQRFIFALGYQHELIEDWLAAQFPTLDYECSVEEEPLGTGGAIKLACEKAGEENVLVTNGDTIFKIDIAQMEAMHHTNAAEATLALKPLQNFDRYGVVETDDNGLVLNFREKQFCEQGNINGGTYLLNLMSFLGNEWPPVFSFEKDYLESKRFRLFGSVQNGYFIDIGIPEDYARAQTELAGTPIDIKNIDKSWTLFIDRDGVINHEKSGGYILNWREFRFYDGVKDAFKRLNEVFGKIIIVTNQRGVGKGLMTEPDLDSIHQHMFKQIQNAGGRIDKVYYCTSIEKDHPDRKPNPGMAFHAREDFPSIDLSRSIVIGNKPSDMLFGRNAGMHTVYVATTHPETPFPHPDIDLRFDSLAEFAKAL
ncbi:MAG TPA: HAD-IIIA family hydrolase [Chitinophagaceae bacterium]|jgi:D-glycero-alpha-D-manno-heptose 1-phosphate guanylyltransferase|nr:HAD-IIIA family hydrolase [Chitinophagaceae bacterium]